MSKFNVLVVDDEEDARDFVACILEREFGEETLELINADSGNSAIETLKGNAAIQCVVCDYNMPNGNGGEVFKFVSTEKKGLAYILVSTEKPSEHEEFSQGQLTAFVEKPFIQEPLVDAIRELMDKADFQAPTEEELPDYARITLNLLLKANPLYHDLYLKISDSKYMKVMNKGDFFEKGDFDRFKSKNADHLYYKKNEGADFMKSFQDRIHKIVLAKSVSAEQLFSASKDTHKTIQYFSQSLGWDPEIEHLAETNTDLAIKAINENPSLSELMGRIIIDPDNYLASHSSVLSYVTCGVSHMLGWDEAPTMQKLAMASLLHDLTLSDQQVSSIESLNDLASASASSDMKEIMDYRSHPVAAAELVRKLEHCPEGVEAIIAQHHERPDGKGFPKHLNYSKIDDLAALFIVCETFVDFIHHPENKSNIPVYLKTYAPLFAQGTFKDAFLALARSFAK